MDDDIQLPPLPPKPPVTDPDAAMQAYGRACYKAGVVIGERRAKVNAKPEVHRARWELCGDGFPRRIMLDARTSITNVILCWTDDGRVWIESERNRELARRLRFYPSPNYDSQAMVTAADALDGGER